MANPVYINKKEYDAIFDAHGIVTNALESCTGDEETIEHLRSIISALHSLERKMTGKNKKEKEIN